MNRYAPHLDWISTQHDRMSRLVEQWANINSASTNLHGLSQMEAALRPELARLGRPIDAVELRPRLSVDSRGKLVEQPLGRMLRVNARPPDARMNVLLGIHTDTVYPPTAVLQTCRREGNILRGPGVADAKGGIAVLLVAIAALQRSAWADEIGWEIFLNPDEELGSPGSAEPLREIARDFDFGLLFEPALPDGAMVSQRRGSANVTVVVRGRSAHVGRDPQAGRSAIVALCRLIARFDELPREHPRATINVGHIEGGGAVNVVPDLAIARLNARFDTIEDAEALLADLRRAATPSDGIEFEFHGGITAPPKPIDAPTQRLIDALDHCGKSLGVAITWRPSGGVSDGNRLAAAGLPNIDTLGPRGDGIHSPDELLYLDSLIERAQLASLLLMRLASGELPWKAGGA